MTDLAVLDATAQAELVHTGQASPIELVDAAITRIDKLNPELNAVIHPLFDKARAAANDADLPNGPFKGVPIAIKDLDGTTEGDPFHQGTRFLKDLDFHSDHDSFLMEKLRAAGFVLVGKTNTPELGLMPSTEPLAYGPTRNPWNPAHTAGGSSGGSAAAVAAGMVPIANAGDGGGSIRIPASACGLFGLKPGRGRISLGPDLGEAWAGFVARHVVTRSVRDCAALLDVLAGGMPGDPYVAPLPARPYAEEVGADAGKLRIGLRTAAPADMAETAPECALAAEDAGRLLESLGHTVEQASPAALHEAELLTHFLTVLTTWTAVELEELEQLTGKAITPAEVEPATWFFAETGRATTAAHYVNALNALHAWSRRMARWWTDDGFDVLLTPTMAVPPPTLPYIAADGDDPMAGLTKATPMAAFTAPFNVTGQPAASVPFAMSSKGLPLGIQLVSDAHHEDVLIRLAAQLEAARPWSDRRPAIHA